MIRLQTFRETFKNHIMAATMRLCIKLVRITTFHHLRRTHYFSTSGASNEILWRSIRRDAGIENPPILFRDVYDRTKVLHNSDAE